MFKNKIASGLVFMLTALLSCEKKQEIIAETKIKPPIRSYIVTARIDKKGTNSNSEGTAVLKGTYSEGTKSLSYTLEYTKVQPLSITLRNGKIGSTGALIMEIYKKGTDDFVSPQSPISGGLTLTPLQERNLLKGLWFVTVNTLTMNPEISGVLTLKQK